MISALPLVLLLVLVWFALTLPLAVLIGRAIAVGQSASTRGRLAQAAVQAGRRPSHAAGHRTGRSAAA